MSAPSRVDSAVKPAAAHRLLAALVLPQRACAFSAGRGSPLLPYSVGSSLFYKTTSQSNVFALGSIVIPPSHLPKVAALLRLREPKIRALRPATSVFVGLVRCQTQKPLSTAAAENPRVLRPLAAVGRQPDNRSCSPLKAAPLADLSELRPCLPKAHWAQRRPGPPVAGHTYSPFRPPVCRWAVIMV